MNGPGSIADGGIVGGGLPCSTASSTSFFHFFWTALAVSARELCFRSSSAILGSRLRSIMASAGFVASMPGVLLVPENPTTAAHRVIGCDQDREASTRRAV